MTSQEYITISQIYDDGVRELDELRAKMASDYEMPPLDMLG